MIFARQSNAGYHHHHYNEMSDNWLSSFSCACIFDPKQVFPGAVKIMGKLAELDQQRATPWQNKGTPQKSLSQQTICLISNSLSNQFWTLCWSLAKKSDEKTI